MVISGLFLTFFHWCGPGVSIKSQEFAAATLHEQSYFSNGYYIKENVQRHYDNLLVVEKIIRSDPENNISPASLDTLYALQGLLHYYLWETYQASYLLCKNIETDLYKAPPKGVNNPNLPLMFIDGLSNQAHDFIESNFLSNPVQGETLSSDYTKVQKCMDTVRSQAKEEVFFIQNDEGGMVADPNYLARKSCFHKKESIDMFEDYLATDGRLHDVYHKKLLLSNLYENTPELVNSDRSIKLAESLSSTFTDSIANDSFSAMIFRLVGLYIQNGKLNQRQAEEIILNANYTRKNELLELLLASQGSSKWNISDDIEPNLTTDDFLAYPHPTLTPLHLLTYAIYISQLGYPIKASELVNEFWHYETNSRPSRTWWFDNYPKFLIESYAIGRLDGARLPMWLEVYFEITGNDPTLNSQLELLKYYNVCRFNNPIHRQSMHSQKLPSSPKI